MSAVDVNALKSEIRAALINRKANACPIASRLAWHASGTYSVKDNNGGSNGATMRFGPEADEDANAGLGIVRDLLLPIKKRHPEISFADLWTLAGGLAIEFSGGPHIPFTFGRTDASGPAVGCPASGWGRLPDGALGADHIRDVFYRMGFNDREIVALIGAHTMGRCHKVRSGFDGPWTRNALQFDNTYYSNLLDLEWQPRKWDGKLQYEDTKTQKLMMLPADMALRSDPEFRKFAEMYADDQQIFFDDFAQAFAKLCNLGCPTVLKQKEKTERELASAQFLEYAMHGSVHELKKLKAHANVHAIEATSGRSALHKAAFWGHIDTVEFLLKDCHLDIDVQDYNKDTALHDACKFGHIDVVKCLLSCGARTSIVNAANQTPMDLANAQDKHEVVKLLQPHHL